MPEDMPQEISTNTGTAAEAPSAAVPKPSNGSDAAPSAGNGSDPKAAAAPDEPLELDDAGRLRIAKLVTLQKVLVYAVKLADLNESYGLLQVAARLIDLACEASDAKKTHADGLAVVTATLKKIDDQRYDVEKTADELIELIERFSGRRNAPRQ